VIQVDHINRDPTDNYFKNLRWVTQAENMKNRALQENYYTIPAAQYTENGQLVENFNSMIEAFLRTRIAKEHIRKCINGQIKTTTDSNGIKYCWKNTLP
jgi:HNH endonuclease